MKLSLVKKSVIITTILLFSLVNQTVSAKTSIIWEAELTIEIVFDKSEFNISQSREPITFHGWVNYTGISLIPFTIHLECQSDLGEVFLSQYEFTFRLPDSIPFEGFIPISPEWNYFTTPQMTISGYVEQGGIQYEMPPQTCLIPVHYYEEVNSIDETIDLRENNDYSFLLEFLVLLVLFTIFIRLLRRRKSR